MKVHATDVIKYFEDNPDLLSNLVDRLMLDDLLSGECSSTEFFLQSLKDAKNDVLKRYHETRLAQLNGGE